MTEQVSPAAQTEALRTAMTEYAAAIRGDWSEFDGRSERDVIEGWVSEIEEPDPAHTIAWWRDELGICPDGNGHWAGFKWGHCRDADCPIQVAREKTNEGGPHV